MGRCCGSCTMPRTVPNTVARLRAAISNPAPAESQILFISPRDRKNGIARCAGQRQRFVSQIESKRKRCLNSGARAPGRRRNRLMRIPGFSGALRGGGQKKNSRLLEQKNWRRDEIRGNQHLAFGRLAAGHRARRRPRHLAAMLAVHAFRLLSRNLFVMMTGNRALLRVAAGSVGAPCGRDERRVKEHHSEQRNTGLGSAPAILPEEIHHPIRSPNIAQSPRSSHTKAAENQDN